MKVLAWLSLSAGMFIAVSPQLLAAERIPAPGAAAQHAAPVTEFSARKKRAVVVVTPAIAAPAAHGWTGADPARGPGTEQLRVYQRESRCVIDEGYGRYTFCSNM